MREEGEEEIDIYHEGNSTELQDFHVTKMRIGANN